MHLLSHNYTVSESLHFSAYLSSETFPKIDACSICFFIPFCVLIFFFLQKRVFLFLFSIFRNFLTRAWDMFDIFGVEKVTALGLRQSPSPNDGYENQSDDESPTRKYSAIKKSKKRWSFIGTSKRLDISHRKVNRTPMPSIENPPRNPPRALPTPK